MTKTFICIFQALIQCIAIYIIIFSQMPKISKCDKIKFFILMWLYFIISFMFIPNQLRFILFMIVSSVIMYFILNVKEKTLLLYSFNTITIMSISEIIISLLLVLLGIKSNEIVDNITYNLLANILISAVSIMIIKIPCIKRLIRKIIELFKNNKKLNNYLYVFLIILYLIVLKNGMEFLLKSNYYINVFFIFGIFVILSIVIRNELKSEQLQEMNKQMLNYVTKYEKIITEQGKANHEFKNQLMVIKGYAQMPPSQTSANKLLEYLELVINDSKKTSSSYLISQLNKFPMGGIKGVIYYKLSLMEDEKIKYEIDVETGVKTKLNSLNVSMYKNITKILGVLLDNAIDASKKSKNRIIMLSVTKEKCAVIFNISNSYKGKIKLDKIGTGYSTKGSGHGYGLRLVNDIIESNSDYKIENEVNKEYYVTKLIIKTCPKRKKKWFAFSFKLWAEKKF